MKYLYLASAVILVACAMEMPSKDEDYYGSLKQITDPYLMFLISPVHGDGYRVHDLEKLRAYYNALSIDSQMLRKLLLAKLSNTPKIKKEFDEIDKVSSSFSTLNQLT